MNKFFIIFLISILFLIPGSVFAQTAPKYITIVHPIRSASIIQNSRNVMNYLVYQNNKQLPATWLIQYDNLYDSQILSSLKNLSANQEIGIFLEVSEKLASDSLTPYLFGNGNWARSDKVFLSGYSPSDRLRMIDTIFKRFREVYGNYPVSVGAWYIDAVSANYLVQKYKVKAFLLCTDQYVTDGYGLWGMPWGVPYIPSKLNLMIPAQNDDSTLPAVVIQWAARDPVLGYGLTVQDSTYSIQANDYMDFHKLDTKYFDALARSYLNANIHLNQLTIGLEVGQESDRFVAELDNQIDTVLKITGSKNSFVTMSKFSEIMQDRHNTPENVSSLVSGIDTHEKRNESYWYNSPYYRVGIFKKDNALFLEDLREYDSGQNFPDMGQGDKNTKLIREIPACIDALTKKNAVQLITDVVKVEIIQTDTEVNMLIYKKDKKIVKITLSPKEIKIDEKIIFSISDPSLISLLLRKVKQSFLAGIVLQNHSFVPSFRFSKIENTYYAGISIDPTHLWGIQTRFPFFGSFSFPFQTLVRFQMLHLPDLDALLAQYFSKHDVKCTIKL
jgi:hypothetical protein